MRPQQGICPGAHLSLWSGPVRSRRRYGGEPPPSAHSNLGRPSPARNTGGSLPVQVRPDHVGLLAVRERVGVVLVCARKEIVSIKIT